MTLMGTWIGGYFEGLGLVPGEDFDYFSFPTIDEDIPRASLGPIIPLSFPRALPMLTLPKLSWYI